MTLLSRHQMSQCIVIVGTFILTIGSCYGKEVVRLSNSISLQQNHFFLGTQAFTSPTDMASSGVWEHT